MLFFVIFFEACFLKSEIDIILKIPHRLNKPGLNPPLFLKKF